MPRPRRPGFWNRGTEPTVGRSAWGSWWRGFNVALLGWAAVAAWGCLPAREGPQAPPDPRCLDRMDRAACDAADTCVWTTDDSGTSRCLPEPPDCRVQGCSDNLTCAPLGTWCLPRCDGGECCGPWHQCQRLDAGEPEGI